MVILGKPYTRDQIARALSDAFAHSKRVRESATCFSDKTPNDETKTQSPLLSSSKADGLQDLLRDFCRFDENREI